VNAAILPQIDVFVCDFGFGNDILVTSNVVGYTKILPCILELVSGLFTYPKSRSAYHMILGADAAIMVHLLQEIIS
jgi:hypothetical protein